MRGIKKVKKEKKKAKNEGVQPLPGLSREDYLVSILLCILTLLVYAFTAAPGITLEEDSADFVNGVATLGIVHPPGYPLYTVLGHLFVQLPLGEVAYRVNVFSALWGALCLGIMVLNLRMLSIERIHAVFATLFLGFTTVFWSKTAIAEVYSFNAFLTALIVFYILKYNSTRKPTDLYLAFFATGLALSNHYPLVILACAGLVFLLDRNDLDLRAVAKGLLFLGLGLTPYLYLFIQALNPDVQYNFAKNSTFSMVVDHIRRRTYTDAYGGTLWDKLGLAVVFFKAIVTNFLAASVFLVVGLAVSFWQRWRYRYPILIAALAPSLGLIAILTFPSDGTFTAFLLDYLIPSFLFLSIFGALGVNACMSRYVRNKIAQLALLGVVLVAQAGFNFTSSSHHQDRLGEVWGAEFLDSLERDSILIVCGPDSFTLYYQQLVKGVRPDVTFYDRHSAMTKQNLYEPDLIYRRSDSVEYRKRRERELIAQAKRPVYYTCRDALDDLGIEFSLTPFVYHANKKPSQGADATPSAVSERLLDSLASEHPTSDHWLHHNRRVIFGRLISFYGGQKRPEVSRLLGRLRQTTLYSDAKFMLSVANNLYYFQNYDLARQFYERAEELSSGSFAATDLAVFCHILASGGHHERALVVCRRQEESSAPCEENTVKTRETIAGIYKEQGDWRKVGQYAKKILGCQPGHETAQRYLQLATSKGQVDQ